MSHMQPLCQEWTENSACDIKCIEGYTIASNTFKCKAVDSKTALGTWTGNVSCTSKSCGVPPSLANTLHTFVERHFLDTVTYNCKSGYYFNGLRYGTLSPTIANLTVLMKFHTLHASQSIALLKMRSLRRRLIFQVDFCRAVHQWCWVLTNVEVSMLRKSYSFWNP